MNYGVLYRSEFRNFNDSKCRVDVLKEGYMGEALSCVLENKSVNIEYQDIEIDDVFQKSNCSFNLVSEINFQFVNLYTTSIIGYMVEVWREHVLLWRGFIDSEQYSEPFDKLDNYTVKVTASDIGILDRVKTDRYDGLVMVSALMGEANMKMNGLFDRIVFATSLQSGGQTFDRLYVSRSSFFDAEESEYLSYREVLENVLLPAGMISVQHRGQWVVTDRDSLSMENAPCRIYNADGSLWGNSSMINNDGDAEGSIGGVDSELSVAPTYNNVKITYDPQVDDALMEGEVIKLKGFQREVLYHVGSSGEEGEMNGFGLLLYSTADSTIRPEANGWTKYVGVKPYLSGSEEKYLFITGPARTLENSKGKLMELVQKPYVSKTDGNNQLRVEVEFLLDPRYNYFEQAGEHNSSGEWRWHNQDTCFVYIPIKLYVKDGESGTILCYWDNFNVYDSHKADLKGSWVMGSSVPNNRCFACYYKENRDKNTAIDGWTTNSPAMGHYDGKTLPSRLQKELNKGDLIPMPPVSGNLVLEIWDGVEMFGVDRKPVDWVSRANYKWIGVKSASITVVDSDGLELSTDEIEYSAWIDKNANEKLELDTVFGSNIDLNGNAKGSYFVKNGQTYDIAVDFTRGSETGVIERHLLNTIYSNSGERMNVLRITLRSLFDWGYKTYERWFPGKKFMKVYRSMNVTDGTEEVTLREFTQSRYNVQEMMND